MSAIIDGFLHCWNKNTDYASRLVADLTDEQMVQQPLPADAIPSNHPAWVFSHLNVYLPVIENLVQGQQFADPKEHQFGMLSKPENAPGVYAAKEALMREYLDGHARIAKLLSDADDSIFEQPVLLERWAGVMPNVGLALPYLMFNHENMHLGQISAWRRLQQMPAV